MQKKKGKKNEEMSYNESGYPDLPIFFSLVQSNAGWYIVMQGHKGERGKKSQTPKKTGERKVARKKRREQCTVVALGVRGV